MTSFRYYFFFILHIVVLLLWYASPFYLPWPWVLLTIILYYLQNIILNDHCILSLEQFKDKREGFYYHYLTRLGFKVNKKHLNFVLDHIIPWVIFLIAILYQRVLF
jgi:hypothetical protein